jgi:hypothetical protein
MIGQSGLVYDLAEDHNAGLIAATATRNQRRSASKQSRSGKFRMVVGVALISAGQRVQGSHLLSPLAPASGES